VLQLPAHHNRAADHPVEGVFLDDRAEPQWLAVGEPLPIHPGAYDLWCVYRGYSQVAGEQGRGVLGGLELARQHE